MGTFLFSRVGVFWLWPLSCNEGFGLMSQVNRIGSDRSSRKTQEIVSLTLEPMVIGPIFL